MSKKTISLDHVAQLVFAQDLFLTMMASAISTHERELATELVIGLAHTIQHAPASAQDACASLVKWKAILEKPPTTPAAH